MTYKLNVPTHSNNDPDSAIKRLLERLEILLKKRRNSGVDDDTYTEGFDSGVKEVKAYLEDCLYLYKQDVVMFSIREQGMNNGIHCKDC